MSARGGIETIASGKRVTRINGATGWSSHTIDQEELEQFSFHLSGIQQSSKVLNSRSPISTENFFESCQDGLLLSALINDSAPETIDDRALNLGEKLNKFKITENINLVINSAKAIGCRVVNIGASDIIEGREHLVLGLVWQVIKVGLMAKISLHFHPELTRLLENGETLDEFLKLPPDSILLRWFNFQLKRAGCTRRVTNFGEDLVDSECYLRLLNVLVSEKCSLSALKITDDESRAEAVVANAKAIDCSKYVSVGSILKANHKLNLAFVANLFNHYPGLEQLSEQEKAELDESLFDSEGDRESRTFALWMNSLGVEPFVNNIPSDLSDGRVLLQVLDQINPGSVHWKRVSKSNGNLTRFQALENTNLVVEMCRSLKFSLVGIQGADITDGVKKLTLALVWQMMRQHVIETLKILSKDGCEVNDDDIIKWANSMVKCRDSSLRISSFKDQTLKSGMFLLELLASINSSFVNFDLISGSNDEECLKSNAKYAITIARKLGASIFLLPEDIIQVKPKMLMTFIGSLMAIHLSQKQASSEDK